MAENLPATINWESELKGAALLVKSQLVPKDIRTPEAALFVILAGRDLGLSPVQSLRSIRPIQGKIECSADLQLGLFHRAGGRTRWLKLDHGGAELELSAPWLSGVHVSRFGTEEARRAELLSNPNYRKYPQAMFRSRAITQGLKDIGFLMAAGVYAPGELGGGITVDAQTGEVLPGEETLQISAEISTTAGAMEAQDEEQRRELSNVALTISEAAKNMDMEDALNQWNVLDTDQKVAVWSMLDKPIKDAVRAAQKAAKSRAPSPLAIRELIAKGDYDAAKDLARSMPDAIKQKYLDEIAKAEATTQE